MSAANVAAVVVVAVLDALVTQLLMRGAQRTEIEIQGIDLFTIIVQISFNT